MGSLKLPHASGNSMSIAAPATNPASDLELKLPNTVGTGKINHGNVLEQFLTPCDGSAITVPSGTYTVGNVTAGYSLTTSYVDVTGSSITYTPPAGTTQVVYDFHFVVSLENDTENFSCHKLFVDGTEVTKARYVLGSVGYTETLSTFRWAINIGESTDTTVGRLATWTSGKVIKMQAREYASATEMQIHKTRLWDGAASSQFHIPLIGITAFGVPT